MKKKFIEKSKQMIIPGMPQKPGQLEIDFDKKTSGKKVKQNGHLPDNLGKAIKMPVPDFSNPNRKPTCLEVDFPIAQINALSNLEGNAGKPIYQMSKWWARRRSSVFRSMLIAAATEAPEDPSGAAKKVWDHYYCNHQKAGSFKKLRVLDCFMGGGTTLVEGSRLGMQMTGIDLNPVAWFVVKNELACSDPEQVQQLFDHIEAEVKPQIQPFYTTTCPRGHKGRWIDVDSGETVDINPIELMPEDRHRYRWEGPEVIYTFWAKHGPCQAKGCGHRTPIFRTPVIAEKKLSPFYIDLDCHECGHHFHAELGETRMAPEVKRIVLDDEASFTEMSQEFAQLLKNYDKGKTEERYERSLLLKEKVKDEPGLYCPGCGAFAGKKVLTVIEKHALLQTRPVHRKKKDFNIQRKKVFMHLLIHPEWLKGASGYNGDREIGGWAGAAASDTAEWFERRLENLDLIEIRGKTLPEKIKLYDGSIINTVQGTVPQKGKYICEFCGKKDSFFNTARNYKKTLPLSPYTLQCHCSQCEAQGYNYSGRYFKVPDAEDIRRVSAAEIEWANRSNDDLKNYFPKQKIPVGERTIKRDSLHEWGYTHWWKMFNSRQLLVHTQLFKAVTNAPGNTWPLDVKEQVIGGLQQLLRYCSMFSFYQQKYDKTIPHFSNSNYHPKMLNSEISAFANVGAGRLSGCASLVIEGIKWTQDTWEVFIPDNKKALRLNTEDSIIPGSETYCTSSTELSFIGSELFDLVITDPPFGDNLFYADLADYFYAWLRIPLRKLYGSLQEEYYFKQEQTPHSLEAIENSVEHPDDRENYEKSIFIEAKHLESTRKLTGDDDLQYKDPNPLYRPEPSSDFYCQTLSACWSEAGRLLKNAGIMAFTFHHSQDQAWIDVLKALFDTGFILVQTYPIRSDESKGENAAFGSQSIEYDIIHVCRKRLETPQPVSWARMRRWVKSETQRLKELLENTHGKELPESDLRVILRGKSLEFYSRHYGQVFTGDGQALNVRDALLGINQLLDDLLEDTTETGGLRPPDIAEPASRLYLRVFRNRVEMPRDELHKTLRGTGISQGDLEAKGWIRVVGRVVHVVPVQERFVYFTERGRNRKVIKTDLDQSHFLIGAAIANSGMKIENELNNPNFRIKKSVDEILKWYAEVNKEDVTRSAAKTASQLVEHWRSKRKEKPQRLQLSLFEKLEESE